MSEIPEKCYNNMILKGIALTVVMLRPNVDAFVAKHGIDFGTHELVGSMAVVGRHHPIAHINGPNFRGPVLDDGRVPFQAARH